jgi:hypothetical protein
LATCDSGDREGGRGQEHLGRTSDSHEGLQFRMGSAGNAPDPVSHRPDDGGSGTPTGWAGGCGTGGDDGRDDHR